MAEQQKNQDIKEPKKTKEPEEEKKEKKNLEVAKEPKGEKKQLPLEDEYKKWMGKLNYSETLCRY